MLPRLLAVAALFALTCLAATDPPLERKVTYANAKVSVQFLVRDLVKQVGLRYDFKKSYAQTDPLCRRWLRDVSIKDKPCRQALEEVLKPAGLRYEVENGAVVLYQRNWGEVLKLHP
jgi:hypothetical protein